jgi:hypothetical protein
MSIQYYYTELQKGMIHAGVHEETEDKNYHFYSGLHTEIQDIIDYKEYNTVNRLFHLAMLAEKELQGHQPMKTKTSFTPHLTSTAPSRTATPLGAPSTSLTPSTTAPLQQEQQSLLRPCCSYWALPVRLPSKKSCIAIADGGYVSASNTEYDLALQTNHAGDLADNDDDEQVFQSEQTTEYSTKTYVVQQVLSAHVDQSEKLQRHNLFQIFFVVKGSCNNLVRANFVTKIGLMAHAHTHPYYNQWLNNSGKAKVTHTSIHPLFYWYLS